MLVIKYTKAYPASYAGHTDTLRTIGRIFRRAGANVEYSKGFNPHMELYFSPALPVGVQSTAEYLAVKMEMEDNLLDRLNQFSPKGLTFTHLWQKQANVSALVTSATYRVSCKGLSQYASQMLVDNYAITYEEKGQQVTKVVRDKIYDLQVVDADTFLVTLACGNVNLRCDRLVNHLLAVNNLNADYSIVKIQMQTNGTDMDAFLQS